MATDEKVLAELDCLHRYHRFCETADASADESRYEAWLSYKQAILRRDQMRCCRCGQVRPAGQLDVRPSRPRVGREHVAPDNLVCVCVFCEPASWMIRSRRGSLVM